MQKFLTLKNLKLKFKIKNEFQKFNKIQFLLKINKKEFFPYYNIQ